MGTEGNWEEEEEITMWETFVIEDEKGVLEVLKSEDEDLIMIFLNDDFIGAITEDVEKKWEEINLGINPLQAGWLDSEIV